MKGQGGGHTDWVPGCPAVALPDLLAASDDGGGDDDEEEEDGGGGGGGSLCPS